MVKKITTHSGFFHADDLFAVAVLALKHQTEGIEVKRTRDESAITSADYVVDVGAEYDPANGRFDHHQDPGAGQRENGIPYASFGLVWKEFGLELSGSSVVAERVDQHLVQPIDAGDNGFAIYETLIEDLSPYTIQTVFSIMQPTWQEPKLSFDEAFDRCLVWALEILKREIKLAQAAVEAVDKVREAYDQALDKRVIVLDDHYPWKDTLLDYPEPIYVVSPRIEPGRWGVKAVPNKRFSFEIKKPFPESWAAKKDRDLQEVSGVGDAVFCHRNLFMCVAESREGAILLAQRALDN